MSKASLSAEDAAHIFGANHDKARAWKFALETWGEHWVPNEWGSLIEFVHLYTGERQPTWQPIETAPKDGTCVLLGWDSSWFMIAGRWYEDPFGRHASCWIDDNADDLLDPDGEPPTHWMPLPELPRS